MTNQSTDTISDIPDLRSLAFVQAFAKRLLEQKHLDTNALNRAVRAQEQSGERFDLVLVRLGLISEAQVLLLLGEYFRMPVVSAEEFPKSPVLPHELRPAFLRANKILPIEESDDSILVAIGSPSSRDAAHGISYLLNKKLTVALASEAEIDRALARFYDDDSNTKAVVRSDDDVVHDDDVRQLADLGSDAPVIKLVNELIDRAAAEGASDIHIEPRIDCLAVRFRVDGELHLVEQLPSHLRPAITSRIKIMARLNIAEQRLPQDGRIKTTVRGRDIDLRISSMPTIKGENIVIRLLDKSTVALNFPALGFSEEARERLDSIFREPDGIVLVTGPTGSGKTTTLYAALTALNKPGVKVFTVEDPVEYQINAVSQIQVQPKISLTFAAALRSILRQDPDIILVGEMRDLETAEVAIQAALTGHLVLSTVHTNSAAATITRLVDMGVEPYLITSTVKAIVAQRLVRRLCQKCSSVPDPSSASATALSERSRSLLVQREWRYPHGRKAVGCTACRGTGYTGRLTISEVLLVSEPIRRAVVAKSSEQDIDLIARREGMISMSDDGIMKALNGLTTLDEVLTTVRSV